VPYEHTLCSRYYFRPKEIIRLALIRHVVVFVSVTVAASFVFIYSSAAALRVLPEKLVGLVAPVGMLLCLFLLTRWMLAREGRSPRDQGLDLTLRPAKEWLGGFVAGVALVAIWCVVVWLGAPFHWKPNPEFEVGAMAATFAAWHIWQGVPWIAAMTATTVASFCSARLFYAGEASLRRSSYSRQLRSRHGAAPVDQFSNGAHTLSTAGRSITSTTSAAVRHYDCYPPDREYLLTRRAPSGRSRVPASTAPPPPSLKR
jgi:hypothetical protein